MEIFGSNAMTAAAAPLVFVLLCCKMSANKWTWIMDYVLLYCKQPNEMNGALTLDMHQKVRQSAIGTHTHTFTYGPHKYCWHIIALDSLIFASFHPSSFICFNFLCVVFVATGCELSHDGLDGSERSPEVEIKFGICVWWMKWNISVHP